MFNLLTILFLVLQLLLKSERPIYHEKGDKNAKIKRKDF